jgi:hypothetical protein
MTVLMVIAIFTGSFTEMVSYYGTATVTTTVTDNRINSRLSPHQIGLQTPESPCLQGFQNIHTLPRLTSYVVTPLAYDEPSVSSPVAVSSTICPESPATCPESPATGETSETSHNFTY